MYTIKFNFEQKGLEAITLHNVEAGQSLLEVALGNDIELHHFLEELNDKEEDFIDRAVNPWLNSRLGCQCLLNDGEGEVEVTLPDQTQFLGE